MSLGEGGALPYGDPARSALRYRLHVLNSGREPEALNRHLANATPKYHSRVARSNGPLG